MTSFAGLLPDLPRWLELRSLLLSGDGTVLAAEPGPPVSLVVVDSTGTAAVAGRPAAGVIRAAAERSREILAAPEDAEWVAAALPSWQGEPATLHLRDAEAPPEPPDREARIITPAKLARADVPEALRKALLREARDGTPLAAAFVGGRPVAFCYPSSVTERWWDVSVDTLEPFRRQGHAARAYRGCARHMAGLGRAPVWARSTPTSPRPGSPRSSGSCRSIG